MLSYNELSFLAQNYQSILEGAQLQGIWSYDHQIVFALYKYELFYLVFQFKTSQAQVVLLKESDLKKDSKKSLPVTLFANAHLKNQRLLKVYLPIIGERILQIQFTSGMIQFQLIPGHINLMITSESKTVWLKKPVPIESSPDIQKINSKNLGPQEFSFESEFNRYQSFFKVRKSERSSQDWAIKKERIIQNIKNDIEAKNELIRSLENILSELMLKQDRFDLNKAKIFNINVSNDTKWFELSELLHQLRKRIVQKRDNSELRLKQLESEPLNDVIRVQKSQSAFSKVMKENAIKGRFFEVNGFVVAYSKSGVDGLKLIRAAQPWDLWFHIRDGTGAHFILRRNKGQSVSDATLLEVCRQVLKSAQLTSGAVLVTEVRYVTPIKGASPGLVKYTHERVLQIK